MNSPTARKFASRAAASQAQSDLYRDMAAKLRTMSPDYSSGIVNDEVARMIRLAIELDEDAEYNREAALEAGYDPSEDDAYVSAR
jgi:hypothetical protein